MYGIDLEDACNNPLETGFQIQAETPAGLRVCSRILGDADADFRIFTRKYFQTYTDSINILIQSCVEVNFCIFSSL